MDELDLDSCQEVESSHIKAVGTRDDYLVVQFKKGGAIYRYKGLAHHYPDLIGAESAGRYFHQNIRSEACERLRGEEWPEG